MLCVATEQNLGYRLTEIVIQFISKIKLWGDIMGDCVYYYRVCSNGHPRIDKSASLELNPFCSECGKEVLDRCSKCGRMFQIWNYSGYGEYPIPDVHKLDVPKYCTCCGAPFPWTVSLLSNAATIVEEDEYMSDEERRIMSLSFHDLVIESPETTLATIRFKKCLSTCGEITRKAFQSLIVKFACDTALKLLGL